MGWVYLGAAVIFEVGWAMTLQLTNGFTKPIPIVANLTLAAGGIITLSKALQALPTSTAYPIWVGISMILITLAGAHFYSESLTGMKLLLILLIVTGVCGLKLSS